MMKKPQEIFNDIQISAETNCVLKIKLKESENPVITAVDKVGKSTILLKPTCLYGYQLEKRIITLPEIESVTRYNTYFDHPIFERIRFIKNNISEMRNNFEGFTKEPSGLFKAG